MSKLGKILLSIGFLSLSALLTLRILGLDPEYMDYTTQEYNERGRMTLPGLWLSGEVVKEPIDNWDWVLDVAHPERGNTIMLETQTFLSTFFNIDFPFPILCVITKEYDLFNKLVRNISNSS